MKEDCTTEEKRREEEREGGSEGQRGEDREGMGRKGEETGEVKREWGRERDTIPVQWCTE